MIYFPKFIYFLILYYISIYKSKALILKSTIRFQNDRYKSPSNHGSLLFMSQTADITDSIIFAGVKFNSIISTNLKKLGICNPSPIQSAAISSIASGLSCIIHAETGSGKTLAYLLPLLKRITNDRQSWDKIEAMIIVPTKELAIQVASDISKLIDDNNQKDSQSKLVYLCIQNNPTLPIENIKSAAIIVTTPSPLLELIKISKETSINEINFLVLDEIDRLLRVLGKYATFNDKVVKDNSLIPTQEILERIVAVRTKYNNLSVMQVVAASATVGRPLKRELFKILDPKSQYKEGYPVIRAIETIGSHSSRSVSIPSTIQHVAILRSDTEDMKLNIDKESPLSDETITQKVVSIKEMWNNEFRNYYRGIIFVPTIGDVKQIVGMMKFWGMNEVKNLQEILGIIDTNKKPDNRHDYSRNRGYIQKQDQENDDIIYKEASNTGKMGMTSKSSLERELFVLAVPNARGLHIKDIDLVFILMLPNNMDEYLHMAGRTGRFGNKRSDGMVVSMVTYDELKRIQSWQTPLNIKVEVKYR